MKQNPNKVTEWRSKTVFL